MTAIPPVNIVLDNLTTESGKRLELTTRSNPAMVKAAHVALFFATMITDDDGTLGIKYVKEQLEMVERFAVSSKGESRREYINALKGSSMDLDSANDGGYIVANEDD